MAFTENKKQRARQAAIRFRERNREKINAAQREKAKTPEAREKHRLKMAKYRAANPEKYREIARKSREANREKILTRNRERYKNSPELRARRAQREREYKDSGRRKELYIANRETILAYNKRYRARKKEEVKEYAKWYRAANRPLLREFDRRYAKNLSPRYVKNKIAQKVKYQFGITIRHSEIPANIVGLVTNNLKLKRELKNKLK